MGLLRRRTVKEEADYILCPLGYEFIGYGTDGFSYKKVYTSDASKILRFERICDGRYIFMPCFEEGYSDTGHTAYWLTQDELIACAKLVARLKGRMYEKDL